jgi:hypothetical protein
MVPFSCAPNTWQDSWQVWSRVRIPSEWNFAGISRANGISRGILFGGLLARIAEYLLNGSPRQVKLHTPL